MAAASAPLDVFISYTRADDAWRKRLEVHLTPMVREGLLKASHEGLVGPGEEWAAETAAQLDAAQVILLLLSADYLADDTYWREMERALARHDAGEARVIPIILSPCDWKTPALRRLKPLPGGGEPITVCSNPEAAFAEIAAEIRTAVEKLRGASASPQRTSAQPPVSSGIVLHQLRAPPDDFTGRRRELAALRAKVTRNGVVIAGIAGLTGQGGAGKTALALKLAQELAPQYPARLEIDLQGSKPSPLSPPEIMARVLRAFEPDVKLPDSPGELLDRYRRTLGRHPTLLLLDDARDQDQVKPFVPAPEGCLVLVTSRQRFVLPGLDPYDLDQMTAKDAVALVRRISKDLDKAAAAELAEICGYLPIALETAAGSLAARKDLDPVEYMKRLRRGERGTLVETVLGESLVLLDPEARDFWLRLGVFPGNFDAAAAAVVGEVAADAARELLSELLQRHYLGYDRMSKRYRLHDLARDYARSLLGKTERYAAQKRHASHFIEVAGTADQLYQKGGIAALTGLTLFDREWSNIGAAQTWAAAHANTDDEAARVAGCMPVLSAHCLSLRQLPRERIDWLNTGLAAARRLGWRNHESKLLGNLGSAHAGIGERRKAIDHIEQARAIMRKIGDRRGEGATLGSLGSAYAALGDLSKATVYHEQELAIAREIGSRKGEGLALGGLGLAHAALGDVPKAIKYFEQELAIANEVGDPQGEGAALGNLGCAYAALGDLHEAIRCHERSLAIAREIRDRQSEAVASWNLGRTYEALGDLPRAIEMMRVYIDYERAIGHAEADEEDAKVNELRARLARERGGGAEG